MDRETPGRRRFLRMTVIGGVALGCLTAAGFAVALMTGLLGDRNGLAQDHPTQAQPPADVLAKLKLFKDWGRPDVVLVLTGEQHGYLQPCGCTSPQYGGLTRRYNLFQLLRQRGWPVVAADLGDVPQSPVASNHSLLKHTFEQTLLKYTYSMRALDLMRYSAAGFGEYETKLTLAQVLAEYALNNPTPRVVSANLVRDDKIGQAFIGQVFDWDLAANPAGPKVGIFSLTSASVEKKVKDPGVKFNPDTPTVMAKVQAEMRSKGAELIVLLYQGSLDEAKKCAKFCQDNPKVGRIDVMLCLSDSGEPPAVPLAKVGDTMIVEVGYKGRFVGVVGAFRHKGTASFDLKYQLVSIAPELDTPEGEVKGHKLMALMEEYARTLKDENYLAKYKQTTHPVQVKFPAAEYAGSDACKNCHPHAYKVWNESSEPMGHAKAYQTLVDAKHPSNRQYDGECIVCHTVGFGYKTGFVNLDKTAYLKDVGCESCHGPSSDHVANHKNQALYPLINPYKFRGKAPEGQAAKTARMNAIGDFCMKCHDTDNDNHFDIDKKWPKIIHMTPNGGPGPAANGPQIGAPPK